MPEIPRVSLSSLPPTASNTEERSGHFDQQLPPPPATSSCAADGIPFPPPSPPNTHNTGLSPPESWCLEEAVRVFQNLEEGVGAWGEGCWGPGCPQGPWQGY